MSDRTLRAAVSHAQRRLWLLDRIEPGLPTYNMPAAVLIEGAVDEAAFERAFDRLVQRHEALRTTFELERDELLQVVHESGPRLLRVDLREHADPDAQAVAFAREDAAAPFDLATGPLVRAALLRLSQTRAVFSCNAHHIVSDQWSQELLLADLLRLYADGTDTHAATPYRAYAAWQNERLAKPEAAASREYWRGKLGGEIAPLHLPYDAARPAEMTHRGANFAFEIDANVADGLRTLCRTRRVTPFQLLTALTKVLLYRYSGQSEIVVGTPVAGRDDARFTQVLGNFVNTLVLRDTIDGARSFDDILAQVKTTTQDAYEHAAYPFDLIVGDLQLEPNLGRSPLFDVAVIYQEMGEPGTQRGGLTISPFDFGHASAKFDVSLYFGPSAKGLRVVLNYNTDLFAPQTIARMAGHFATLAAAVAATPGAPVEQLEMLTPPERAHLLEAVNATQTHAPDATIAALFEEQAARHADRVAVTTAQTRLTYRDLNARANTIASALRSEHGVRPGDRVAVLVDPSEWSIAALLGVLKAGAAYVPLDPVYPPERLRFILEDSAPRVLLTQQSYLDRPWNLPAADVFEMQGSCENPPQAGSPSDLAYVIYTSGSTGVPKGCCVEQRSVVSLLRNARMPFTFSEHDTWVLAHSTCFDFSVWEMYGALLYGGHLVVPDRESVRDVDRFWELVKRHRVSVLNQTPAAFSNFIAREAQAQAHDLDDHLRYVVFGGDRLEPSHLQSWIGWYGLDRVALVNMYGITETCVHVTFGQLRERDILAGHGRSPIGVPLPGTRVYALNPAGRLQPIGVAGELYVGGSGLARAYLNRPELTAERFVENPYRPGERLYKSGDLGRWSADGTLEHLGRNDAQVQIRGFRVEIGEVLAALLAHPQIAQAHVVPRDGGDGTRHLVAYVVQRATLDVGDLRAHLRTTLPEYMQPAHVVALDALPLTANGKIDQRRLPEPQRARLRAPSRAPREGVERTLAGIWSRVLGVAVDSAQESFFNAGGDSIKVITLANAIAAELGVRLAVRDVFRHPTIAAQAEIVGQGLHGRDDDRLAAQELLETRCRAIASDPQLRPLLAGCESFFAMSDIQQGMLYHSLLDPQRAIYHEQFVFEAGDDAFDASAFAGALDALVRKHAILRTSFVLGSQAVQIVWPSVDPDFGVLDWSHEEDAAQSALLDRTLAADLQHPFDPARPGLWRLRVARLAPRRVAILWSFHHAILDGWSNASFLAELLETYARRKADSDYEPQMLRATYRDFVADQLAVAASKESAQFWRAYLEDYEKTPLPLVKTADAQALLTRRRKLVTHLDPQQSQALIALARSAGVPVREVYLAAFAAWLALVSGRARTLFGVVGHGRPSIEDGERIVGCFLNSVPLRCGSSGDASPLELIAAVHEQVERVRPHERLSTREIAQLAGATGEGNPLFDVLFNFIDFHVLGRLDSATIAGARMLASAESTNTLLDFSVNGTFGDYSVSLYYLEGLYDESEAARLAAYFTRILEQFVQAPERAIEAGALLGDERRALLERGTARSDYPRDASVVQLFEEQARLHGARPAVAMGGVTLSYAQLDARANAVAQALVRSHGVRPGECVAIRLPRSQQAIVAMLGIVKAGAAYVPLDPEFPARRSEHIVAQTGARVVLTGGGVVPLGLAGVVELDLAQIADGAEAAGLPATGACDLAYVIYTSGSTGLPKGSLIEQRSIVRLVRNTNYIAIEPDDRIAQAGSIAFDACTFEVWGALLNGACVSVLDSASLADAQSFSQALRAQRITVLFLTTSLFNQFAESDPRMFDGLRVLLTGGENASPEHFELVRAACPSLALSHVYGPTENTTFSTFHRVAGPCQNVVPIGRPIAGSTAYLLDASLRLVPTGTPGELCTGGDGVARGYVHDEAGARGVFTADPFVAGGRLYRTGDLARWLPDGSLQFLGRIDGQVKVRGFRVEPGEIEAALHAQPAIVQAIVVPGRSTVGTVELAAYYTTRAPLDPNDLRCALAHALPAPFVPAYLVHLDEMPLSITGKIDRRRLPAPGAGNAESAEVAQPRDQIERLLSTLWCELLGRDRIGIHDDYFALGGDSIKSIQMSSRLRAAGWKLEMRALFEQPTIAALAPKLKPLVALAQAPVDGGEVPLTPVQRWFFDTHTAEVNRFNLSLRLRARGRIDEPALRAALQSIWEHHDALRMRLRTQDGAWQQTVAAPDRVSFSVIDEHDAAQMHELNLANGPLLRAALVRGTAADDVLVVLHHLVADAVSCRILIDDLDRAYRGEALGARTSSFASWSHSLARFARTDVCAQEARYWSGAYDDVPPSLQPDHPGGSNRYGDCRSFDVTLDQAQTAMLLAQRARADVLSLTALARVFDRRGSTNGLCLTLEGHGREPIDDDLDLTRTVGWFTTLFPFRVELAGESARGQVEHVEAALRSLPRKGLSYGVARYLAPPDAAQSCSQALPRIAFNYLGEFGPAASSFFTLAGEVPGAPIDPGIERHNVLDVVGVVLDKSLRFSFTYSAQQFDRATVEALATAFGKELVALAEQLAGEERMPVLARTPLPGVSAEELAAVLGGLQ